MTQPANHVNVAPVAWWVIVAALLAAINPVAIQAVALADSTIYPATGVTGGGIQSING